MVDKLGRKKVGRRKEVREIGKNSVKNGRIRQWREECRQISEVKKVPRRTPGPSAARGHSGTGGGCPWRRARTDPCVDGGGLAFEAPSGRQHKPRLGQRHRPTSPHEGRSFSYFFLLFHNFSYVFLFFSLEITKIKKNTSKTT